MIEYLVSTLIIGTVTLIGAKVYTDRNIEQMKRRDDSFQREVAKLRKMLATLPE